MLTKLFLLLFGIKLFKVAIMVLHHAHKQIDGINVDRMILLPTSFVYHREQGYEDLLSFFLFNLIESKFTHTSVQVTHGFTLEIRMLGVKHHHHTLAEDVLQDCSCFLVLLFELFDVIKVFVWIWGSCILLSSFSLFLFFSCFLSL